MRTTIATHSWWLIGRQSHVAEEALALIRYLVEPEPMLTIAETAADLPVRKSLIGRGILSEPLVDEFARACSVAGEPTPLLANAPEMEEVLLNRLNSMVRGEMTPKRAVREVASAWIDGIARLPYLDRFGPSYARMPATPSRQ